MDIQKYREKIEAEIKKAQEDPNFAIMVKNLEELITTVPSKELKILKDPTETEENRLKAFRTLQLACFGNQLLSVWQDDFFDALKLAAISSSKQLSTAASEYLKRATS